MRRTWLSFTLFTAIAGATVGLGASCREDADTTDDTTSSGTGTTTSSSSGTGGAGAALKILTWNCHNFFDDKDNSAATDEFVKSTAEYQKQLNLIAGVIKDLDPDVAVLQEVENQGVLDALNAAVGNKYAERSLLDGNDPRGVDIAAMSKIPFSDVVTHVDDMFTVVGSPAPSYTFARDAVEYHFTFGGRKIALIGVHYRSKGPPDDANKRLAEAQRSRAIADAITATDPATGIVILGDYNDLPSSDPVTVIKGKAPDLYADAVSSVPVADQWTFDFMGTKELIDHQMANGVMTGFLDPDGGEIIHSASLDDASDHAPMMITYLVK